MSTISDIQEPKVGMIPVVRIRISTDFQASTKRIEPSVTVEIVMPGDGSIDPEALDTALADARIYGLIQFRYALEGAEEHIAAIRPGEKS